MPRSRQGRHGGPGCGIGSSASERRRRGYAMWIEALLTREDLDRIFSELLPLTIDLGTDGDHLEFSDPGEVVLVPDQGVRLSCRAHLRWTMLGIPVPITIKAVAALLKPALVQGADGREVVELGV